MKTLNRILIATWVVAFAVAVLGCGGHTTGHRRGEAESTHGCSDSDVALEGLAFGLVHAARRSDDCRELRRVDARHASEVGALKSKLAAQKRLQASQEQSLTPAGIVVFPTQSGGYGVEHRATLRGARDKRQRLLTGLVCDDSGWTLTTGQLKPAGLHPTLVVFGDDEGNQIVLQMVAAAGRTADKRTRFQLSPEAIDFLQTHRFFNAQVAVGKLVKDIHVDVDAVREWNFSIEAARRLGCGAGGPGDTQKPDAPL